MTRHRVVLVYTQGRQSWASAVFATAWTIPGWYGTTGKE
jgi:hypothetical protein